MKAYKVSEIIGVVRFTFPFEYSACWPLDGIEYQFALKLITK